MKHRDYMDACRRTEHKDMPAYLRNIRTGEIGAVIQCSGFDTPDAFLVTTGSSLTSWSPEEVEEVPRAAVEKPGSGRH